MSDKKTTYTIPDHLKHVEIHDQPHPLLKSLPAHLKDHNNYEKIQKGILDAGATGHSHAEVSDWVKCQHCISKQEDRLKFMRSLGFQSAAQYKAWDVVQKRIQEEKIKQSIKK